jgi:EAL domain-containing protein (putative c-di-GMP-specific phosphodiesterase class I)/ActR/RegA family two-component response regulator
MDDDEDYANYIADVIHTLNLDCMITTKSEDFLHTFDSSVSLVLLDLKLPDIDAVELLEFIKKTQNQCDIILMSGVEDRIIETAEAFARSIGLSVVGRFQKSIRLAELENLLIKCTTNKPVKMQSVSVSRPEFVVTDAELMRAIEQNQFVVYYQPKIDINTRGLHGVEALVRWLHPEHGLIYPDQFIGYAESGSFIEKISWLVIKNAIEEIEVLQDKLQFPFGLALNLSPCLLTIPEFSHKLITLIEQFSFPPERITFEITESGLINELSGALAIFTRLRLKNIQLSIDDFGTGYSMLQQLKIIPASEIKIDKSFVLNMLSENSARVTVQKVIEIGKELGLKVVAEGVESKEHLLFLQRNHCDIAQGYYFSRPIPIVELENWINNNYGFK